MKKEEKTSEFDFDNFEIFHPLRSGKTSIHETYSDLPFMSITKYYCAINFGGQKHIGVEEGSEILFAKNNDVIFVAVVSELSNLKGYRLRKLHRRMHKDVLSFTSTTLFQRGIPKGLYKILESVNIKGMDWFEMELIGE